MPLATNDDTGRAIRQAVDAGHLKGHLETFSTLFRDSGTEDERQAAEYLYERLQSYGLEPEILTFDSYISWPREGQLQVTLPDGTAQDVPVRTRSFGGSTTDGAIEAEMVFIPFAAPER